MTARESTSALLFVHLSDLHFRESGSPLAEREAGLRERLLEDIPKAVALAGGQDVEAVLVTGDVARSGHREEYRVGRTWLDRLCRLLGISETKTLTCPGNHDVDWDRLDQDRLNANADLRACDDRLLDLKIDAMLSDPDSVLGPLEDYQEFAAGTACSIERRLAWDIPAIPFGAGYVLSIVGANSVINSDKHDGVGTMAIQTNQLRVVREPGVVRMLLIHHSPFFWRRPMPRPAEYGHNIALYGHTHVADHAVVGDSCVEVTAGAVHPEEKEFAIPGYNVLRVTIEEPSDAADTAFARVQVWCRTFNRDLDAFDESGPDPDIDERVLILRAATPEYVEAAGEQGVAMAGESETQPSLETAAGDPDPSRLVALAFERLGAADRLRILDIVDIPRVEIIDLLAHRQIREVARRVVAEQKVDRFLTAAAELDAS